MKVLITGSSGFIGGHLVEYLIREGHKVFGLDKRIPKIMIPELQFTQCDILEKNSLIKLSTECAPDAIIHLAAETELNKRTKNAYAANVEGVINLTEAISYTKNIQRVIFTSTMLVCHVGYIPKTDIEFAPKTPYGRSKVLTEQIVRQMDGGGSKWCIVRPTTVWGPGNIHSVNYFKMIKRGLYFHVGKKPLYKSYSYVKNIAFQYAQLLKAPEEYFYGRVYYLADYEPTSLRKWANAFQRELRGRRIPIYPELMARVLARIGDIIIKGGFKKCPFNTYRLNNILTEYIFDLREIENICGQLPYTIDQGVRETAKWAKDILEKPEKIF